MRKSVRYIIVRAEVVHPEDVEPEDVIEEAFYNFKATTDEADFVDTEIVGIEEDIYR